MSDYARLMAIVSNNPNDLDAFKALSELQQIRDRRERSKVPHVGMAVTYHIGSDRYPGTIVEVRRNGKTIVMKKQRTYIRRIDGKEYQVYVNYLDNDTTTFTLRGNGDYRMKGCKYGSLSLGARRFHQDPGF